MLNRPSFSRIPLGLILGLAFFLRVYHSGTHGIFLDEKYTMVISQGVVMGGSNQKDVFYTPGKTYFTPREFWKEKTFNDFIEANIRGDIGNSPTYYGVLWVWMKLFGLSDFSARLLSVVCSTLLVGLLYVFVRRHLKSTPLALISAFLAAIEPFFVAYSQMARNYSMSFLLTLLATHLLLLILETRSSPRRRNVLYVAYGLTIAATILSHYLTIAIFLCHGLYVLGFVRPPRRWIPLLVTALLALGVVSLWFIYGGGKYTFQTLAYQAKLYGSLAKTNPEHNDFGLILPATPLNLFERSLPLWSDLFVFSNGLGKVDYLGYRNMGIVLVLGLGAMGVLHYFQNRKPIPFWAPALFLILLVIGLPVYTSPKLEYVVLATLPSLFYLLYAYLKQNIKIYTPALISFIILLATIPTLFLMAMAIRNGHTYGITQRYSGFSFPYTCILVGMVLLEIRRLYWPFQLILGGVLVLQSIFVARLLHHIYEGREAKYTYFSVPRMKNPYMLAAERIKKSYAPGDTVLYPSVRLHPRDEVEKTYSDFSIEDAQLTNLYLPKEATYIQRMDTTQQNQILLIKGKTGKAEVIFDFQGRKYRY